MEISVDVASDIAAYFLKTFFDTASINDSSFYERFYGTDSRLLVSKEHADRDAETIVLQNKNDIIEYLKKLPPSAKIISHFAALPTSNGIIITVCGNETIDVNDYLWSRTFHLVQSDQSYYLKADILQYQIGRQLELSVESCVEPIAVIAAVEAAVEKVEQETVKPEEEPTIVVNAIVEELPVVVQEESVVAIPVIQNELQQSEAVKPNPKKAQKKNNAKRPSRPKNSPSKIVPVETDIVVAQEEPVVDAVEEKEVVEEVTKPEIVNTVVVPAPVKPSVPKTWANIARLEGATPADDAVVATGDEAVVPVAKDQKQSVYKKTRPYNNNNNNNNYNNRANTGRQNEVFINNIPKSIKGAEFGQIFVKQFGEVLKLSFDASRGSAVIALPSPALAKAVIESGRLNYPSGESSPIYPSRPPRSNKNYDNSTNKKTD